MRPWTSSCAASRASSRTRGSSSASATRRSGGVRRRLDELDALGEHHLGVERPVHRALHSDDLQLLNLLRRQAGGKAVDELEARRKAALGRFLLALDLNAAEVPALELGVHHHCD